MIRAMLFAAVVLSLSACKTDILVEAYTSDLREVAEGGDPINADIGVRVSVLSESSCTDNREELQGVLSELIADVSFDRCTKEGLDTFAKFRGKAQIAPFPKSPPEQIGIYATTANSSFGFGVVLDTNSIKVAREKLPIGTRIDPADITMTVRVISDSRNTEYLAAGNVFIDGKPTTKARVIELARRERVDLRLSDVTLGELLLIGGAYAFNMGEALKAGLKE